MLINVLLGVVPLPVHHVIILRKEIQSTQQVLEDVGQQACGLGGVGCEE